jgi:hypothetical protein
MSSGKSAYACRMSAYKVCPPCGGSSTARRALYDDRCWLKDESVCQSPLPLACHQARLPLGIMLPSASRFPASYRWFEEARLGLLRPWIDSRAPKFFEYRTCVSSFKPVERKASTPYLFWRSMISETMGGERGREKSTPCTSAPKFESVNGIAWRVRDETVASVRGWAPVRPLATQRDAESVFHILETDWYFELELQVCDV